MVGATPVFVDIEPDTFNIDVAQVESKITSRTKAIIPVHLFGHAADMDPVMELAQRYGLKVLEDVAQAFGARYRGRMVGTIGDIGAFSFFPTKNLGCYGDGGLLTTNDDTVADMAAMLRAHGSRKKYFNEEIGYNSRLDEIQAAILRVKLPHLQRANEGRRLAAARYDGLLRDVTGVPPPVERSYTSHVYHQYTVRIDGGRRDEMQLYLDREGISTMIYYPVPLHQLPVYKELGYRFLESEIAAREVLSLPIWPNIAEETQAQVVAAIRQGMDAGPVRAVAPG
jgi:dTDP-4-amino-4,6-dideoxygalactose transaminase